MSAKRVLQAMRDELGTLPEDIDRMTLERVFTEPEMESLAEAIAADAVDAIPIIGDMLIIVRMNRAEEMGKTYPESPAPVQNYLSDIPAPFDTVGDILVSQHTAEYLDLYDEIEDTQTPTEIAENAALDLGERIRAITPDPQ